MNVCRQCSEPTPEQRPSAIARGRGLFCSRACFNTSRRMTAERIRSIFGGMRPDDCWPWPYTRGRQGYGHVSIDNRPRPAHRVAYELLVEPVAPHLVVRHLCNNPPCCNPRHLAVGTQADNIADKQAGPRAQRGETHPTAKLTNYQARTIFYLCRAGVAQRAIASRYGVSQQTVSRISAGKRWGVALALRTFLLTNDQEDAA